MRQLTTATLALEKADVSSFSSLTKFELDTIWKRLNPSHVCIAVNRESLGIPMSTLKLQVKICRVRVRVEKRKKQNKKTFFIRL